MTEVKLKFRIEKVFSDYVEVAISGEPRLVDQIVIAVRKAMEKEEGIEEI